MNLRSGVWSRMVNEQKRDRGPSSAPCPARNGHLMVPTLTCLPPYGQTKRVGTSSLLASVIRATALQATDPAGCGWPGRRVCLKGRPTAGSFLWSGLLERQKLTRTSRGGQVAPGGFTFLPGTGEGRGPRTLSMSLPRCATHNTEETRGV